ncbi:Shiga toxin A subunit [Leclercia adecarboxylata]|uniref:Shiga toxin A subunit n=1 Tax=Leclercia TaxID=83654 RepID=UPI001BDC1407|nr:MULTISPECIES: Shiga toxin A subunit [Leclercia]MCZ7840521.1 Shiga toxin A subunit [Leclercia adecarboxylata]QVV61949.1 Shiga toxin A subunit [Leclercia sp. Colony189]
MLNKKSLYLLIIYPFLTHANNNGCAIVGASMETALFNAISRDLQIDTSTIQRNKTTIKIIDLSPVSKLYAQSLAKIDYEMAVAQGKATIPEGAYLDSYYENNTQSLTVKYTYINKKKKEDIFIASGLINDDECSVRFNGYMVIAREF